MKKIYIFGILIGVIISVLTAVHFLYQPNTFSNNWKRYHSEQFHFSTDYPSELKISTGKNEPRVDFMDESYQKSFIGFYVVSLAPGVGIGVDTTNINGTEMNISWATKNHQQSIVSFINKKTLYTVFLNNLSKRETLRILESIELDK
jgi:hypothetical protein